MPQTPQDIVVSLPQPHKGQLRVLKSDARYLVVRCGRRWGKTTAGAMLAVLAALDGKRVGWFSPTYRMLLDSWRLMKDWCAPVITSRNEVEREFRLISGGQMRCYSLDNPESPRGEAFHLAVVDEAAQIAHLDRAWEGAIRPTLSDFSGRAVFLSTPRIGSYFSSTLCHKSGRGWEQIVAPTYENPAIPQSEIEEARQVLPDWVFRQEYLAEIVTQVGEVFRAEWFRSVPSAPPSLNWVRYWDLALTVTEDSSYTASVRGALDADGTLYLADMIRGRWEWPTCRRVMISTMQSERNVVHYIESAVHGRAAVQDLLQAPEVADVAILPLHVDRDKVSRALPWAVRASAGKVMLVEGSWVNDFLEEVVSFPNGRHDDQVDAVSGVVEVLAKSSLGEPTIVTVARPKQPTWREIWGRSA